MLEGEKLTSEVLGKWVKVNGIEESTHVIWADKIERLANAIPDTNGLLIDIVRRGLPEALRKLITHNPASWSTFCNEIRAVSLTEIEEEQARVKETEKLKADVKQMKEQATPSKPLGNVFHNITLGSPLPQPRFNVPRTFTPPQTAPTSTVPYTAPSRPFNTTFQSNRSVTDRANDLVRLALVMHPNTAAGQVAYNNQVIEWHAANPEGRVNEFHPYPLTPGTSSAGMGECWNCGNRGHMGRDCQGTKVPKMESKWRSIAATIKRHAAQPPPTPTQINFVAADDGSWLTQEQYDRTVIEKHYYDMQGKADGPSA